MNNENIALIDIGSNSIRLVIFQIDQKGYYKEVQNLKIVPRLSSHIGHNRELSDQGITKLIEALQQFQSVTRAYQIDKTKCVATAAVRQAKNQAEILKEVHSKTDFSIRVLSEYEEAYFGYLAVTNSTNIENGITIDIGGGSTEVTLFKNRKLIKYHSFPFGAISLKQKFFNEETPTREELDKLQLFLHSQFCSLKWLYNNNDIPLIGIGGSARNLSLIHQRKVNYPLRGLHHYEMKYEDINKITRHLNKLSLRGRQMVDGLSKDRADIIGSALMVFCSLMEVSQTSTFIMSNKGLRDGLFYEELFIKLNCDQFSNVVEESLYQLSQDYAVNKRHVRYITKIVTRLFNELKNKTYCSFFTNEDLRLLKLSCRVLYVGDFISREASSENTFYLLTNRSIDGLTHIERVKIALIASFKSKSTFQSYLQNYRSWFSKDEIVKLEILGSMLKFSYALNRTNRNIITNLKIIEESSDQIKLKFIFENNPYFEQVQAEKYKKHLEKALNLPIELLFSHME